MGQDTQVVSSRQKQNLSTPPPSTLHRHARPQVAHRIHLHPVLLYAQLTLIACAAACLAVSDVLSVAHHTVLPCCPRPRPKTTKKPWSYSLYFAQPTLIACSAACLAVSNVLSVAHHIVLPCCPRPRPKTTKKPWSYSLYSAQPTLIACSAACLAVSDVLPVAHHVCGVGLTLTLLRPKATHDVHVQT